MIVRFVSSLNHEEETLLARAILKAAAGLLDPLPIAYSIRIETSGSTVYEHSRPADDLMTRHVGAVLTFTARELPKA